MTKKMIHPNGTDCIEFHIFYILDTSGSMSGQPLKVLNDGMRSAIEELKKISKVPTNIKIAVLEFNSDCRWVTNGYNGIVEVQDFFWHDLNAGGFTYLGKALDELKRCLDVHETTCSITETRIPIMIFMSDGEPNDDWEVSLKNLSHNKWYRKAVKFAVAYGDHADVEVLAAVVGRWDEDNVIPREEAVLRTCNLQELLEMLKVVSAEAISEGQSLSTKYGETDPPDFDDGII